MQNNKTEETYQNTKNPLNLPTIQITNSYNEIEKNYNNIKQNNPKPHFVRRVSFDNYDPDSNLIAHIKDCNNNKSNNTTNMPLNSDNTANNSVKPTSILKNFNNNNSAPQTDNNNNNDNNNIRDLSSISANNDKQPLTLINDNNNNNNNNNPVKPNTLSITSLSSTSPALPIPSSSSLSSSPSPSSSPTSPTSFSSNNRLSSNNNNVSSINNNSLQFTNPFNNNRKKSYNEMSDSELLALDNQFNVRSVDIEKSYGFNVTPRLSIGSVSNSDKNSLNCNINNKNQQFNTNFKNLSKNAMLNEYPTKPIITKNSICFNFKHSNLKNTELNGKFYLILLSNESSSLSSLNYYIDNISSKGDTIVICCSLSTSILGNDKNDSLNEFIKSFTNLILHHLDLNSIYPINITFEFFKTGKFFNEVLNLYQPSLVIVGTNNEKTKSTSLTTIDKKLLSIVYVGHNNNDSKINFKIPNYSAKNDTNNDINNLTKMKTNDTANSSLFENLNGTPNLDLSKTYSNSTSYSNEFLKPTDSSNMNSSSNLLLNPNQPTQRRRSMLDVLNPDTKNNLSRYSSNDSNCAIDDSSDSNIPSDFKKLSINSNYELHKQPSRGSNASSDTPKLLSGPEKQKQELFEKYQRRLSAVKVGPQTTNNKISTNKSKSLSPESNTKTSSSENKSFLKKWFK